MTTNRRQLVPIAGDIIRALDDPRLFGPLFAGASWQPWRVFLRALFGLPMGEAELATYRHHTGRQNAPEQPFKEAALVCGRRGGKSRILGLIAVYLATMRNYAGLIAPGETAIVAVIAADRRQARVILSYIVGTLRAVPVLAALIVDVLAESVTLANGVVVEIHTGSIGAPRGRTFAAVLADEIAHWRNDESAANPDAEIIAAVRPGLATIPGAMLLMASSPYAKRGVLYKTFVRHFGHDDSRTLVWRGSTVEMNPALDPAVVEAAREEDSESARAEYDAEFRDDLTDYIDRAVVEAAVARGLVEMSPAAGVAYAAFCDPSGGSSDSMTLAIGHVDRDGIAVLDCLRETRAPFSPDLVVQDFSAVLRSYGLTRVTGDRYAGEWPRERFATHGITYESSAAPKSEIYKELLPLMNGRRVQLLDQPRLVAQLCGLERRTARGGRDSIDHAPGGHDDVVNSAAGVLVRVVADRRPSLIRQSDMMVDNKPVAMPRWAQVVFAVLVIGADGMAAVAYFAQHEVAGLPDPAPLTLVDFALEPLTGRTVGAMFGRLEELHREIPRVRARMAWLPAPYLLHAHLEGHEADAWPEAMLADLPGLALSAAGHVNAGRFKIAEPAAEKARNLPLAGALSFRAGEAIDADPLRLAVLIAIELALTPESARGAPVLPAARAVAS